MTDTDCWVTFTIMAVLLLVATIVNSIREDRARAAHSKALSMEANRSFQRGWNMGYTQGYDHARGRHGYRAYPIHATSLLITPDSILPDDDRDPAPGTGWEDPK